MTRTDPSESQAENVLLTLMNCPTRAEFEKACASLTLSQTDLVHVILAAAADAIPIKYHRQIRKLLPAHLEVDDGFLKKARPLENPARLMRRLGEIFRHPRELIAHFFYLEDGRTWWLVMFDYLDISDRRTGWAAGQHVHMLSYLTHPKASPNDFLEEILWAEKPRLPHPVHIRFQRRDSVPLPVGKGDAPRSNGEQPIRFLS